MKKIFILLLVFISFTIIKAEENPTPKSIQQDTTKFNTESSSINNVLKYIGAIECGICHTEVYESWKKQRHSKAYDRLQNSDKENPKCLKCHTTGYGEQKFYEQVNLEGVQCEACHGPGSLYRPMNIMKVRKKANELGLIFPIDPLKVCRKCHLHRQDRMTPLCPGRD
ncbi:cytochrome c family protein [Candidatus Desantisbacteria bacterium]|nr:cytochrome c family protein [Candidatus Desantisbacteria bacterium]